MYIPNTLWTWSFMLTTLAQAIVVLAIEAYLFIQFQLSIVDDLPPRALTKTIPTYLTLFIFGFLYQLLLVWDSLRLKNTIQVIGLCIYNIGMLVYASIQFDQIRRAIDGLKKVSFGGKFYITPDDDIWMQIRPYLMTVPIIIGIFTVVMGFIAWKLYDEFAWTIYKHISADLRMKRRFLTFQIYIALLKFDFFFFLGFAVQFLVIVEELAVSELALTIAAIPITVAILFSAAFFTRRENLFGMIVTIVLYFCGMAYFIFKLTRMYQPGFQQNYQPVRKNLTSFAVITLMLIILTIINACVCASNFNKGLKQHISKRKIMTEDDKAEQVLEMQPDANYNAAGPSRMTID